MVNVLWWNFRANWYSGCSHKSLLSVVLICGEGLAGASNTHKPRCGLSLFLSFEADDPGFVNAGKFEQIASRLR